LIRVADYAGLKYLNHQYQVSGYILTVQLASGVRLHGENRVCGGRRRGGVAVLELL